MSCSDVETENSNSLPKGQENGNQDMVTTGRGPTVPLATITQCAPVSTGNVNSSSPPYQHEPTKQWNLPPQGFIGHWNPSQLAPVSQWIPPPQQSSVSQWIPPQQTPVNQWTPPQQAPVSQWTPPQQAPANQWTPPQQAPVSQWIPPQQSSVPQWNPIQESVSQWVASQQASVSQWNPSPYQDMNRWNPAQQSCGPLCNICNANISSPGRPLTGPWNPLHVYSQLPPLPSNGELNTPSQAELTSKEKMSNSLLQLNIGPSNRCPPPSSAVKTSENFVNSGKFSSALEKQYGNASYLQAQPPGSVVNETKTSYRSRPLTWNISRNIICRFCRQNGEEEYFHEMVNEKKEVTCPVLMAYRCRLCGATGSKAHTLKYCPMNPYTRGDPVAAGFRPGLTPSHLNPFLHSRR